VLSLGEGRQAIQAIAHDAAGNASTPAERFVQVDSGAPAIEVVSPEEGFLTREESVRVEGRVVDSSPASLTIDGTPVGLTDGQFSTDVAVSEGPVSVVLRAVDAVGLEATRGVSGFVDRTAPEVEVVSPGAESPVLALPVVLSGLVSDGPSGAPGPVRVTVDGEEATVTGQAWQVSLDDVPKGPHTFQVVATDPAGNQRTVGHPVWVDLLPPTVQITSPASGALTRASSSGWRGT